MSLCGCRVVEDVGICSSASPAAWRGCLFQDVGSTEKSLYTTLGTAIFGVGRARVAERHDDALLDWHVRHDEAVVLGGRGEGHCLVDGLEVSDSCGAPWFERQFTAESSGFRNSTR